MDELPEEEVFVPQALAAAAQQQRLVEGLSEAVKGRGNQKEIHAQAFGGGVGQGVAEDGLAVAPLELQQNGLHLIVSVVSVNVHPVPHHLAQPPGTLRDVGSGNEGGLPVQAVGQTEGAEKVVHGHLDLHHRQGQIPAEHSGGSAPGDDHIIVPVEIGPGYFRAQLPVTHEESQVHLGIFLRQVRHEGFHALVGGDAEHTKTVFHKPSQTCLYFKRLRFSWKIRKIRLSNGRTIAVFQVKCRFSMVDAFYYFKMVDYLKKALIYGHTSRISS